MKNKKLWSGAAASAGMLVLILDSRTALAGARSGIALCLQTVIPSLFPFFVLSMIITSVWSGSSLAILRPLARFCGIPEGAEAFFVSGFLGGYPVGAQAIAQAWREGKLTRAEAERMLGFCNNAGPAFLFGMAASLFPKLWMAWALWGIHIVSAIMATLFLPRVPCRKLPPYAGAPMGLPEALGRSISAIASVCGWVVLFRVVITFLQRWVLWLLPVPLQVSVMGLLELANGCCALAAVDNVSLRFLLCSGMLALGGLCVAMQTLSVTSGLNLGLYVRGKLLQTLFSVVLSAAVISGSGVLILAAVVLPALFLWKKQKRCSISKKAAV